jgi:hypothetical protein
VLRGGQRDVVGSMGSPVAVAVAALTCSVFAALYLLWRLCGCHVRGPQWAGQLLLVHWLPPREPERAARPPIQLGLTGVGGTFPSVPACAAAIPRAGLRESIGIIAASLADARRPKTGLRAGYPESRCSRGKLY